MVVVLEDYNCGHIIGYSQKVVNDCLMMNTQHINFINSHTIISIYMYCTIH